MRARRWIATLVLAGGIAAGSSWANGFETKPFDDAAFKAAQTEGRSVIVHVTAPWCPTCKVQHQALESLSEKPDLDSVIVFNVDFDGQKDVLKSVKARTQATLIAFKGASETGRLIGSINSEAIEGLIQSSLK